MANERMYLYCRNCGARFYLGKHCCGPFHFSDNYAASIGEELEKFYEDHAYCDGGFWNSEHAEKVDERYETDYDGVSDFGIVYESSAIYMKMPRGDNL